MAFSERFVCGLSEVNVALSCAILNCTSLGSCQKGVLHTLGFQLIIGASTYFDKYRPINRSDKARYWTRKKLIRQHLYAIAG
jgi:hypothetical protein